MPAAVRRRLKNKNGRIQWPSDLEFPFVQAVHDQLVHTRSLNLTSWTWVDTAVQLKEVEKSPEMKKHMTWRWCWIRGKMAQIYNFEEETKESYFELTATVSEAKEKKLIPGTFCKDVYNILRPLCKVEHGKAVKLWDGGKAVFDSGDLLCFRRAAPEKTKDKVATVKNRGDKRHNPQEEHKDDNHEDEVVILYEIDVHAPPKKCRKYPSRAAGRASGVPNGNIKAWKEIKHSTPKPPKKRLCRHGGRWGRPPAMMKEDFTLPQSSEDGINQDHVNNAAEDEKNTETSKEVESAHEAADGLPCLPSSPSPKVFLSSSSDEEAVEAGQALFEMKAAPHGPPLNNNQKKAEQKTTLKEGIANSQEMGPNSKLPTEQAVQDADSDDQLVELKKAAKKPRKKKPEYTEPPVHIHHHHININVCLPSGPTIMAAMVSALYEKPTQEI